MPPNKNYEAGRRFEYEIMEYLEKKGYKGLTRGAGSHGFDVIGIDCNGWATFIEAKVTEDWPPPLYEEERRKLVEELTDTANYMADALALPTNILEFWIKFKRRGWLRMVYYPPERAWRPCKDTMSDAAKNEECFLEWCKKMGKPYDD